MAEKGLPATAVNEAVIDCATRLTNVEPTRALDEKMAIYGTYGSAYISDSLREAFSAELQLPWAPSSDLEERWTTLPEHVQGAYLRQGHAAAQIFGESSPVRSESPIRRTLHHPLVYFLAFVVVAIASTANGHDVAQILGEGIGAAIVVWFLTAFLP
jgi:hypothetical protein